MRRYTIRTLTSDDFATLAKLATGDERSVAKIDQATLERLRPKYERLGFVAARVVAEAA